MVKWSEICKTYEKATPGPWDVWGEVADVSRGYVESGDNRPICCCVTGEDENGGAVQLDEDMENAKAIAFSRTALPMLVTAIQMMLTCSPADARASLLWALQEAGITMDDR